MRIQIITSIAALFFFACGPSHPHAGEEGYPCYNWTGSCNDGLTCVDDVCRGCGGHGERCCHDSCDPGFACESSFGEEGVCQNDCGLPGLPCCESEMGGYCPGGTVCDPVTDLCEGDVSNACLSGSTPYSVWVVDGSCNAFEVVFLVDSEEEAETCRQALLAAALPTEEVCLVGQVPEYTTVCREGPILDETLHLPTCTEAQLQTCMSFQCIGPECTWHAGACS